MFLLYGVIILCLSVLWWSLAMICCRNPKARWYGGEDMQAFIWAPFSTAGLILGLLLIRKSLPGFPPSILEVILTVAVIAVTVVLYRLLNVKQRLLAYQEEEAHTRAAADSSQTDSPADRQPPPVSTPTLISPDLQKAV